MFEKEVVVDGRAHLFGRLASVVAKELLCGQKVVVVRCEAIAMSGGRARHNAKEWPVVAFNAAPTPCSRQSHATRPRSLVGVTSATPRNRKDTERLVGAGRLPRLSVRSRPCPLALVR